MKTHTSSEWLVSENKAGDEKYWQLSILSDGDKWYTQTAWYQVTKLGKESTIQYSEPYYATPTNVGRANERDSKAQAEFEFDSILKKQQDKGYRVKGQKKQERPMPMLAHKFADHHKKVTFPVYVQPKLDGMRMLFDGEVGHSRGNKEIIPEVIQHLKFDTGGYILDGELMLPGNVLLQESMKAIKKYRPELSPKLMYYVYDIVDDTLTYEERLTIINELTENSPDCATFVALNVKRVPTWKANSEVEVLTLHKQFTKEGYEGTMLRNPNATYEIGKRSYSLLKMKDFQDAEFEIIGVLEGDGSSKGLAIFKCITEEGKEFDSTPEASHEQRREWFTDRKNLIGKFATVKFQGWTDDGKPTFNNTLAIRERGDF